MTAAIENIGGGPLGLCRVFWYQVGDAYPCTLNRADPQVWIPDELLTATREGRGHPFLSLTQVPQSIWPSECRESHPGHCFYGALLRIEADNQTVIYRIGEYVPEHHAWWGRWPD